MKVILTLAQVQLKRATNFHMGLTTAMMEERQKQVKYRWRVDAGDEWARRRHSDRETGYCGYGAETERSKLEKLSNY